MPASSRTDLFAAQNNMPRTILRPRVPGHILGAVDADTTSTTWPSSRPVAERSAPDSSFFGDWLRSGDIGHLDDLEAVLRDEIAALTKG
jgi:hypothetical protein